MSQALLPLGDKPGEQIEEITVEHGPSAVVQAWEFASWLTRRLEWHVIGGKVVQNVEMVWRFHTGSRDALVRIRRLEAGLPRIQRVRLAYKIDGKPVAMILTPQGDERLVIEFEGIEGEPRTIMIPPHTPAELIGRQLSDRERDPVFRDSMLTAQAMAQLVLR